MFSPIVLCFLGNPRDLWKQRITSIAIPLCILIAIAFVAFRLSYQKELNIIEVGFEKNAAHFTSELRNSVDSHMEATNNLKEFLDNSDEVTAEIFSRYRKPNLSRHPDIQALEWIPLVAHKDRESFESQNNIQIRTSDAN